MRKYFWRDRFGMDLTFKEFMSRWKEGIQGITPLQQSKTTLFSFMPIFAGILWGIVITFLSHTYWLTLILSGSLPLTTIQFISTYQKYLSHKVVDKVMRELR